MARILVIEDDHRVAELLKRGLQESGHIVYCSDSIFNSYEIFQDNTFDIVVSDVLLPDGSGFDLCQKIRQSNQKIPIIMLTALGTTDDKLEGFNSGADDYMVKPFDFRELEARIQVLLKRRVDKLSDEVEKIQYADLKIDLLTKTVYRDGVLISLTPKEYNLLLFFMRNPDRVLSRSEIAQKVWDTHFDTGTNFIDVYINYLRKKIDKNFKSKLIHTRLGMGFILTNQNNENRN
ncbi:MAG: response regulator transcription factor [Bacteroidales bacterium]